MKDSLRWAYAINAWNFRMDVFVRHEDQLRALKTMSVLGFDHVELAAGMGGRWENLGHPGIIEINHGGPEGLLAFLARAGVQGVSSWSWDPGQPAEETGYAFWMTRNPADHDAIVEASKPFIEMLGAIGGEQPVGRTTQPSSARCGTASARSPRLPAYASRCTTTACRASTRESSWSRSSTPPMRRPSASRSTRPSSRSAGSTRWRSTTRTTTA